jgi:hypothetical protein
MLAVHEYSDNISKLIFYFAAWVSHTVWAFIYRVFTYYLQGICIVRSSTLYKGTMIPSSELCALSEFVGWVISGNFRVWTLQIRVHFTSS